MWRWYRCAGPGTGGLGLAATAAGLTALPRCRRADEEEWEPPATTPAAFRAGLTADGRSRSPPTIGATSTARRERTGHRPRSPPHRRRGAGAAARRRRWPRCRSRAARRRPATAASSSATAGRRSPAATRATGSSRATSPPRPTLRTTAACERGTLADPYTAARDHVRPRRRVGGRHRPRRRALGRLAEGRAAVDRRDARRVRQRPAEPARRRRAHQPLEGRRRRRDLAAAQQAVPLRLRRPPGRRQAPVQRVGHRRRARRDRPRARRLPRPDAPPRRRPPPGHGRSTTPAPRQPLVPAAERPARARLRQLHRGRAAGSRRCGAAPPTTPPTPASTATRTASPARADRIGSVAGVTDVPSDPRRRQPLAQGMSARFAQRSAAASRTMASAASTSAT